MCLTRIYTERNDGKLMRFKSEKCLKTYMRRCGEVMGTTIRRIDRSDFIDMRNRRYNTPKWIDSKPFPGMSMLAEA